MDAGFGSDGGRNLCGRFDVTIFLSASIYGIRLQTNVFNNHQGGNVSSASMIIRPFEEDWFSAGPSGGQYYSFPRSTILTDPQ